MKKLEISQIENLQGGKRSFDDCMNSGLSQWQLQLVYYPALAQELAD